MKLDEWCYDPGETMANRVMIEYIRGSYGFSCWDGLDIFLSSFLALYSFTPIILAGYKVYKASGKVQQRLNPKQQIELRAKTKTMAKAGPAWCQCILTCEKDHFFFLPPSELLTITRSRDV
ncbi:hypothetical protein VNO78_08422 [Psophocarpus tetragonolobus]|uniref:Uncharacterized protein n=1 Tax=Psophocarpus tetragonolobus TaxID=3891 RepID=A0AAN9SUT0_PSOTE